MGAESTDDFGIPLFAVSGEAFPVAERPDIANNKRLRGKPFNTSAGPATPSTASSGHKVVVAGGVLDGGALGAGVIGSGGRPWRLA